MISDLTDLGYTTFRENSTTLIYRSSMPDFKDLAGIKGPLGKRSSLNGRSPIRIIEPDMAVRTLMHGGLFRHITGKNFLSPARTIRELKVSAYLASKAIPTPEILAVRLLKKGPFYHIEVVSRLVPESTDLLTYSKHPVTTVWRCSRMRAGSSGGSIALGVPCGPPYQESPPGWQQDPLAARSR